MSTAWACGTYAGGENVRDVCVLLAQVVDERLFRLEAHVSTELEHERLAG